MHPNDFLDDCTQLLTQALTFDQALDAPAWANFLASNDARAAESAKVFLQRFTPSCANDA